MPFPDGSEIALRQLFRGRVWSATAARVIVDSADLIVLWMPEGSDRRHPATGDLFGEWTLAASPLHRPILRLTRPGDAHSTLLFRHEDGSFRGWYVNLELPMVRTPVGFDFHDLLLDLWLVPGREWEWLDEDEAADALARGYLSADDLALARAEGERVIAEHPFPTGWESWEPDPSWPIPGLPARWDAVERD